jgi:hypothetical protein
VSLSDITEVEGKTESKEYSRYNLFVLALPVFFILPLALFSLQECWQAWSQGHLALADSGLAEALWSPQLTDTYAWTALVQGVSWLAFVTLITAGFLMQRGSLMGMGYLVLFVSVFLQWQLPPLLATVS